jgi:polynucleotide 5'-hydroxyl-kinase GRC3/NOL9
MCPFVAGPPFTHPIMPYRAHYVGHSTPRSSPSHYLACIQALVQIYRMDVQYAYQEPDDISDEEGVQEASPKRTDNRSQSFVPLVVNTQGWLKGLGGDLLRKIEEIVEATDTFDLDMKPAAFPQRNQHTHPCNTRLHAVRPILSSPLAMYFTPADHRSLSILSYFHSRFSTRGREVRSWSTELPLCAHQPWEVDCKEAILRFVLVGAGREDVVPLELAHAINCGIVALVCDEDVPLDPAVTGDDSCIYTQGAPVPSPSTSRCLGLALIRGVNATVDILHLLTPVSPTLLHKCRVLVMGELELPAWGMLDFRQGQTEGVAGIKWGKVPYLQMGGREAAAIGGTRRRVRKNLMRRSQM